LDQGFGSAFKSIEPEYTRRSNYVALRSCIAAHRWIPILDWIAGYRRDRLLPDVPAGLALRAVMVPEGMACAGIVGE
jgi:hypothetical protein